MTIKVYKSDSIDLTKPAPTQVNLLKLNTATVPTRRCLSDDEEAEII